MRIIDEKTYERVLKYETFDELGETYSPVLFRDFDLINEATASNSDDFMQSVTTHILARKIPLHSKERPLFYLPIKSTILDAVIYLNGNNFDRIESVYRNHEKVPMHTVLEYDDIITYTISPEKTIQKKWNECVHSGISRWRI